MIKEQKKLIKYFLSSFEILTCNLCNGFISTNKDYLKDKSAVNEDNVETIEKTKIARREKTICCEDQNVNLKQNNYYYLVIAINSYNNKRKLSELVSTE